MLFEMERDNCFQNNIHLDREYLINVNWNGVMINKTIEDLMAVEDEIVYDCAAGYATPLAKVSDMLGIAFTASEEDHLYFTKDFPLGFTLERSKKTIKGIPVFNLDLCCNPVEDEGMFDKDATPVNNDQKIKSHKTVIETLFDRQTEALRKIRSLKQNLIIQKEDYFCSILKDVDHIIDILEGSYD